MSGIETPEPFSVENFRKLKGPLIDLRTPQEFSQGHWPGAINLPLFNNEERIIIGKTYKKKGQRKAIILGLELIRPRLLGIIKSLKEIKEEKRLRNYGDISQHLKLYCWRGGMRSASVAWLSNLFDLSPVLLLGGYKAYRKWVLKQFINDWPIKLIGGKTGSGKTDLLLSLSKKGISIIDLEGLANHRGSTFGSLGLPPQPSTEHYENIIGEKLYKFSQGNNKEIWVEAESANLGCCTIPHEFFKQMKQAEMLEITRTSKERISNLSEVYGCQNSQQLEEATLRISKRLGPQRTVKALNAIKRKNWFAACAEMLDYYDRCYEHGLIKVKRKTSIDISGLSSDEAAEKLLKKGFIFSANSPQS
tara:strand:+ start:17 stop:1102 length:1086 start_codon:yes stop_codon:yes gene_type:complete